MGDSDEIKIGSPAYHLALEFLSQAMADGRVSRTDFAYTTAMSKNPALKVYKSEDGATQFRKDMMKIVSRYNVTRDPVYTDFLYVPNLVLESNLPGTDPHIRNMGTFLFPAPSDLRN